MWVLHASRGRGFGETSVNPIFMHHVGALRMLLFNFARKFPVKNNAPPVCAISDAEIFTNTGNNNDDLLH